MHQVLIQNKCQYHNHKHHATRIRLPDPLRFQQLID